MLVDTTLHKAMRLNKLLPLPVRARRYYKLKGDNSPSVLDLPTAVSSLTEDCFLSIMARTDAFKGHFVDKVEHLPPGVVSHRCVNQG